MSQSVKMATGISSGIVPLTGTNYNTWKVQCKMALLKNQVWDIVAGTETAPTDAAPLAAYQIRKDKALATIVLAVDPTLLYLLGEPEDPKIVWDKLQGQFQKKSWANKLSLRKRLYAMRLDEGGSVQDHLRNMLDIFNELAIVGSPVDDEDKVVHLLASLPPTYDMLVTALESNTSVPSMETVTERLLHTERKLTEEESEHGLVSRRGKFNTKGPRCFRCKKHGHIKKNCPQVKDKAYKAEAEDSSDESVTIVLEHVLTVKSSKEWIVDSGATTHMCNDKTLFTEMNAVNDVKVSLGDGRVLKAFGRGRVKLKVSVSNCSKSHVLYDVLFVPDLAYNLISVSSIGKTNDMITVFCESGCEVKTTDGKVVATGTRRGKLYYLDCVDGNHEVVNIKETACTTVDDWHRRYGHLSETSLRKLSNEGLVDGFDFDTSRKLSFCEACVEGKQHRTKFNTSTSRCNEILGLIHSDVCGKVDPSSLGGAQYFLTFIDDCSRYTWVYVLKSKDEVFEKFKEWKCITEKSLGQKIKILRTDNGGEYTSKEFEKFLRNEGI